MYFVYIVECIDRTLYTGSTSDIEKRLKRHNSGRGAKYVRSKLPAVLVYSEEFETRSEALKREVAIKRLSRDEKLELINRY